MDSSSKIQHWLSKNKRSVQIGGTALFLLGSGLGYILCKNKQIPFPEQLKLWTMKELYDAYKEFLPEFHRTNVKPFKMQQIDHEIALRGAKEWFAKHPPNTDPNYRWTDALRWDRD